MPRVAAPEEEAMSEGTSGAMTSRTSRISLRLTTTACVLGLVGIFFSLLHFVWPTPLNFALFMIAGQGSFGLALVTYVAVVLKDLRRKKIL
jgi:hypothetical protein